MVRLMLPHELDSVLDLWCEMGDAVGATYSKVLWVQSTTQLLASGAYYIFVLEEDGRIAGFADYMLKMEPGENALIGISRYLYLQGLARKFGAAKVLIDAVIQDIKSRGGKKVMFHTTEDTMLKWGNHGFDTKSIIYEKVL